MEAVTIVPPERYEEAFKCLFARRRGRALRESIRQLSAAGRLLPGCMHAIEDDRGQMRSAVLAVLSPGRTASLLRSPVAESCDGEDGLLVACMAALQDWPVDLAQSLINLSDGPLLACYLASGFTHLADLHTMMRSVPRRAALLPLPSGVELFDADDQSILTVLEHTYAHTQDCPALRGLRRTRDVLAGHRAGGQVHKDLWQLVCCDGDPVGCVLMTCDAGHTADLAYLGLTPAMRGRGVAAAVLQHMLQRLSSHGMRRVRLAVDAANEPALRLYRSAGFRRTLTQRAAIRSVREMQAGQG